MPKITYIEHDGSKHTVDAEIGSTVMETALRNDIASIVAECGGSCACATRLVHADEKWFEVVGPPSAEEEEQLDAAFEVKPTSRLSCQIRVTETLDGLGRSYASLSRAVSITPPHVVVSRPAPHAKRCLTLLVHSCGSPQPLHSRRCWQKAVLPSETSG